MPYYLLRQIILTTLTRDIQFEKFIQDESVSLLVYPSWYNFNMCTLELGVLQKEPVLCQIEKSTKEPLFRCGQKMCENVFFI